ncbi:RNA-binding domain-containing protein, partial [Meredithblackwellia eburnea MCA 4105]
VFVGGLSWNVDNEWLSEVVCGELEIKEEDMISVRVARNHMGRSKGFGFVEFTTPELANRAAALESRDIDGREAQFRMCLPVAPRSDKPSDRRPNKVNRRPTRLQPLNPASDTLWIGNMPWQATRDDLENIFSTFGVVTRVSIPTDSDTGKPRGIAYVQFDSDEPAKDAVDEAFCGNGFELDGRNLVLDFASPTGQAPPRSPRSPGGPRLDRGPRSDRGSRSMGGKPRTPRRGASFDLRE